MSYRHKKSVKRPEVEQQYIYCVSRLYRRLIPAQQEKIRRLCKEAGGEYADALLALVTDDRTVTSVCMEFHVSEPTMYRVLRKYYQAFPVPFT